MKKDISILQKNKLKKLKKTIRTWESCIVAYSGGVDSTLLMKVASEVLNQNAMAVIATSSTYPKRELESALKWLNDNKIRHEIIISEELDIPEFRNNPPDRCYHCKKELYSKICDIASRNHIEVIADGANFDDIGDFRHGMHAAKELCVLSPLKEIGFTKDDIRQISASIYRLDTAFRQPMACLASRFPYGSQITGDKLRQVEEVEDFLHHSGLAIFRARHHGDVLRIEIDKREIPKIFENGLAEKIVEQGKQAGFAYITIDLQGFRSGSINETIKI
jgi:uncharacterized protein